MFTKQTTKRILIATAIGIVYFVAGNLGLKLAFVNQSATAVWPPTGIALAAFLLFGYRIWPAIFLGAFFVNFLITGWTPTTFAISIGNTLEGFAGAYLINRFAFGRRVFEQPQAIFKFIILGPILSTVISATFGVTSLVLGGFATWFEYGAIWLTWWLGDAAGSFLVAPLLILWFSQVPRRLKLEKVLELIAVCWLLFLVGLIIFGPLVPSAIKSYPIEFLTIPIVVWVAYRFSPRETTTAVLILSAVAIWGTLQGFGPFAQFPPNESLLLLQSFMATISIMALVLSSASLQQRLGEQLKTNFFSMAAHQLRTPLGTMRWNLEVLLSKKNNKYPTFVKKHLETIYESNKKMITQTTELLDIARADTRNLKPNTRVINPITIIKETMEEFSKEAKKGDILVSLDTTDYKLGQISLDPTLFKEVIQNLLSNAIIYNKKGGSVSIKIENADDILKLTVKDTGVGISTDETVKIFEKYYRTDYAASSNATGAGLGLALVKSYVESWGGDVYFESKLGKGSTFHVNLPTVSLP